ncbi:aldo/keto reductase [Pseudoxanthomonas mexicana]|uniref:aldo/keto reductase n=1 Tax=Pseudoxanthomonas mexicana TaxID=128785 RepID=UPI0028B061C4|nr:aldo/keto reductase [Pseudoxanthomonas mexicana]
MQYRRLGTSGLQVSALSFGAWLTFGQQVGPREAGELIALAWDHGINFFDNAEVYGHGEAERVMGEALRALGLPRDGFCVSSKVCFGSVENPRPTQRGLSRKHVFDACHAALRRLQVDYLDLYYCHRPDPDTPVEETVWAMDSLIRQGKVLYWGTSEWPAARIREAATIARKHHLHGPTMEQPQYNLLHRQRVELQYAPLYAELGLGTTTWSPLASGLLTGKYGKDIAGDTRLGRAGHEELRRMVLGAEGARRPERAARYAAAAAELGEKPAPLAIAWCLQNPHVSSVILGASRPEQLRENLTALELAGRYDEPVWARLTAAAD